MNFFTQPFLGSGEASNRIVGRIKMGSDTLAVIEGHWDQDVYIKDKRSEVRIKFFLFIKVYKKYFHFINQLRVYGEPI